MARVRVVRMLLLVGALALGTGVLQEADRGTVRSAGADRLAAASPARGVAAPASQAAVAPRRAPAVLRLVSPRPAARLHITFPRTWRPVKLEVGSPVHQPPLRVFCATCPPGTVLEVDL
jgi:hypothetical protein